METSDSDSSLNSAPVDPVLDLYGRVLGLNPNNAVHRALLEEEIDTSDSDSSSDFTDSTDDDEDALNDLAGLRFDR